jgi:F-type H+-transporting ATPase subunit b
MNTLALLALQSSEGQIAAIARTFGVDWAHLGAQIVSFSIVCLLLYKFAYKHVLAMLEERRAQIAQGLANAEKIRYELARTEAQRQEVLTQAREEAAMFIEEARAAAARLLEQETRNAMIAAGQITTNARKDAEQDYERMLRQLKQEVGGLVVRTTAAVAGRILTDDDQRRLAEETAKQVAA